MRRKSAPLWLAAAMSVTVLAACSTVPSSKVLMDGVDVKAAKTLPAGTTMRAQSDPICTQYYTNVFEAARKAAKAKQNNKRFAATGVSIATSMIGLGPVGSVATSGAAQIALAQSPNIVATTQFDPEKSFDKKIIDGANELKCPISVKRQATTQLKKP